MISIFINNEQLDVEASALVTFKKSQQLNGIQNLYSYSNNFTLQNSAKNRRLLGISYLPNSKAKSMTKGYDVDVILNGCIFLKKQKLKVQKETDKNIPVYLIFTDNFLVAKAKEVLMNQLVLGVTYTKNIIDFVIYNNDLNPLYRSAPISAQDKSGLIVVEEVPVLLNVKELLIKAFTQLGYAYTGDILTDENIGKYYTSSNAGVYGPDGVPRFGDTMTVYDFIVDFLKTFNGYIEVSDSSRSLGLYLWKNIEAKKTNFVEYSSKYTGFSEYAFEGGLAKVNTIEYSDSPNFYNGFFNNNKSIIDKSTYLTSKFGAGNLHLFADQDLEEDGSILPRTIGEITDPQTMNLFRFESVLTSVPVYSSGLLGYQSLNKAFSPNIFEIWQIFHQPYCDNISLPTIGQIKFRYDALFLSNFKMSEVFFVKQLSTYWLPLELNFTSKKDGVRVKALMVEKTQVDIPIVFDQNIAVGFYGEVFILDLNALYSAQNVSPAATMAITAADLAKNNIFVNGIQILSFPTSINVSALFEVRVENIESVNVKSNSDILFRFISEQGGLSREATINVAHSGRATFISEFRSELDAVFTYGQEGVDSLNRVLNYAGAVISPVNIPSTFLPLTGDLPPAPAGPVEFKVLQFDRNSFVTVELSIGLLHLHCSNRGGGAEARTRVYFRLWKNGSLFITVYSQGAIDRYKSGHTDVDYANVFAAKTFNAAAGDAIYIEQYLHLDEEDRAGSGTMDGSVSVTNVKWKFKVTEQL